MPIRDQKKRKMYFREWSRSRRKKLTEELIAYRLSKGCADCGYRERYEALEFDHLPGFKKDFVISSVLSSRSEKRVWEEVGKCEVVCANCHRIRTSERGQLKLADIG